MKKPRNSRAKKPEIKLPPRLDYGTFETLRSDLLKHQGGHLRLVADNVEYLSAAVAELLLMARNSWQKSNHTFEISKPSDAFVTGLGALGISMSDLLIEDTK